MKRSQQTNAEVHCTLSVNLTAWELKENHNIRPKKEVIQYYPKLKHLYYPISSPKKRSKLTNRLIKI
ncbi:hypothetical protein HI914_04719 [Erysiphe necator]|nr:hypothetical protein HI914_04719 [Erysiphe necator]